MKLVEDIRNFIKSLHYPEPNDYCNPDVKESLVIEYSNDVLAKVEELADIVETMANHIEKIDRKIAFYERCINIVEKDAIIQTLEFCEKYSDKKYTGDKTNLKECQAFIDENLDKAENLYDEYLRHTPTM